MNKDCKIIQDLMPNYIEKLTSNESNSFIEKHLSECEDCKNMLNILEEDIAPRKIKNEDINIDYMKKYKRLVNRLKILVVLLLFVIVVPIFSKNIYMYSILTKMYDKNVYSDVGENYVLETYIESFEDDKEPVKTYIKDGIIKEMKGDKNYFYIDTNNDVAYMFIEDKKVYTNMNNTIVNYDSNILKLNISIVSSLNYGDRKPNFFEKIYALLTSNINVYEQEYRNQLYYVITKNVDSEMMWVNKKTGYIERIKENGNVKEFKIITDKVTDNDIKLPDLTEYKYVEDLTVLD